jgi:hypothetical protein
MDEYNELLKKRTGWPKFERYSGDRRKVAPDTIRKRNVVVAKDMNERHHEVARLVVLGYKNTKIAEMLGITKEFVCAVRNAPPVQEQIAILKSARDANTVDIARQIQETLPSCVNYLMETIEDSNISDNVRSRNAFGLLSAGGHGSSSKVSVRGAYAVLTADDIKEIRDNVL